MHVNKRAFGLITVLMLFSQFCIASKPEVIVDFQRTRVLLSDEYTYYGLDFSKLRLINEYKMDQGELIKNKYFPAWLRRFDEKFTEYDLRKQLIVQTINDERYPFQVDQSQKNNSSTIVSYLKSAMSVDTLEIIVQDYQLSKSSGIGFSFIISEFNKEDEEVIGYVTFFDIETRELLYVVKANGSAMGTGMTNHWYYGLLDAWNDYFYMQFGYDKKDAKKEAKKKKK